MDNISHLTAPEVIPKTAHCVTVLANDPNLYKKMMSIFPSEEDLKESHEAHQASFNAAAGSDPERLKELQAARQLLNRRFTIFNMVLKLAAVEDPGLLPKFGITPHKPKKATTYAMTSPLNPQVRHSQISGEMIMKVKPVKNSKSYDISFCVGDPSVEENWKHCAVGAKASKLEIQRLVPGTIYWFRVRAIGANGPGPWSQYVSLMAI